MKHIVKENGESENFIICSAATSREEIGSDTHYGTKSVLRENNIPFERRKAVQLTKEDYKKYDYIIGMDNANISNILKICGGDPENKVHLLLSFAGINKSVEDPWYTGDFHGVFDEITLGCNALFKKIR